MALYRGKKKLTIFKGDRKPYSIYLGKKKLAGYIIKKLQGFSSISWQAPYKARIRNILIEGVGEQEKLTGKNLLPVPQIIFYEQNNPNSNTIASARIDLESLQAGVYTLYENIKIYSDDKSTVQKMSYEIHYKDSSIKRDNILLDNTNNEFQTAILHFEIKETPVSQVIIRLRDYSTTSYSHFEIQKAILIQGNFNENNIPYEPYCGGIPAPNPQYPIQPKFLDGASMTARGKNLIDYLELYKGLSQKNGIISAPARAYLKKVYVIPKELNGKILHVSCLIKTEKTNNVRIRITQKDTTIDSNFINPNNIFNLTKVSFLAETGDKIALTYGSYGDNIVHLKDFQLSFEATTYEPYKQPQTVAIPTLRKIPDTDICDTYNAETGEITRRVKELILTKENSFNPNYIESTNSMVIIIENEKYYAKYGKNACSTHVEKINTASRKGTGIAIRNFKNYFPNIKTVEQMRDYVESEKAKGTPVTVWYPLATPIIEKIEPSVMVATQGSTVLEINKETNFSAEVCLEDNI